jgi:hypothetical protein
MFTFAFLHSSYKILLKMINSVPRNGAVFLKMAIFNFIPGLIAIEPLDFSIICTKWSLDFNPNQPQTLIVFQLSP